MGSCKPPPLILKFDDWPEQDRSAWAQARSPGGLFDDDNALAHWAPYTEKLHRQNYGHWLAFLSTMWPELCAHAPCDRITEATVESYIDYARTRVNTRTASESDNSAGLSPRSIANHIISLTIIAKALAPQRDWSWLSQAARRLYRQANPHELKPPIPLSAREIAAWSLAQLEDLHVTTPAHPVEHAVAFRQALSIGLLIMAPERLRAFIAISTRHLERNAREYLLHFPATNIKTRRARCVPITGRIVRWLDLYIEHYRPLLLAGGDHDGLWISRDSAPLTRDGFQAGLALVTERAFGITLRPHAFRTIAATSIAEYAPEHAGIIREILGHATLDMAEKHYNRATARSATRDLQDIYANIRKPARGKKTPQ